MTLSKQEQGPGDFEVAEINAAAFAALAEGGNIQLIDVREKDEFRRYNIGGINLPISTLEEHIDAIKPGIQTIVICHAGVRSVRAAEIIMHRFPALQVAHLKGGLLALVNQSKI